MQVTSNEPVKMYVGPHQWRAAKCPGCGGKLNFEFQKVVPFAKKEEDSEDIDTFFQPKQKVDLNRVCRKCKGTFSAACLEGKHMPSICGDCSKK